MRGPITQIASDDPRQWSEMLARSGAHDFYHSCAYHRLAETNGEGVARLLCLDDDGQSIALPLLIRALPPGLRAPVDSVTGCDATSVYGYAGPVGPVDAPLRLTRGFGAALTDWLRDAAVVSLFARLHPLLASTHLIAGLGETLTHGPTVSIDLSLPAEERRARYRSNHRRDLKKLRDRGFACWFGSGPDAIGAFTDLYLETMGRVESDAGYRFDRAYFERLLTVPGLDLCLCKIGDEVCAGAIVGFSGDIAQYHLGGTRTAWLRDAPMKLIFDEACEEGLARRCRRLHLGGGLGAREDALFGFKAGFSPDRHTFRTWRWVVDRQAYQALSCATGADIAGGAAFPAYRSRSPT